MKASARGTVPGRARWYCSSAVAETEDSSRRADRLPSPAGMLLQRLGWAWKSLPGWAIAQLGGFGACRGNRLHFVGQGVASGGCGRPGQEHRKRGQKLGQASPGMNGRSARWVPRQALRLELRTDSQALWDLRRERGSARPLLGLETGVQHSRVSRLMGRFGL